MTGASYSEAELDKFRQVQRLAYDCVQHVETQLTAQMTEREAAKLMRDYLSAHGGGQYFHKPFAWFGDRTAFVNFWSDVHFFPSNRRLAWGLPVILDVAPMVDGYAADIGYSCVYGRNDLFERMVLDLASYRTLILRGVRAERTLQQIYREVDELIRSQGYENRHERYPYGVLAHRIGRVGPSRLDRVTVGGFGASALRWLASEGGAFRRGISHPSPFWNDKDQSAHRATPGLWAVEPHIGHQGVGVKWEELLVVTEGDAFWLDDDLPHVRRWKSSPPPAPRPSASGTA
jgi:Xaa-Pro aminopeptidase